MPTPVGTAGDMTPRRQRTAAARVRKAGRVVLGKTTMPEFGMLASGVSSLHGITRSWKLTRNPAGSSSGAGAAIVAGYGPLALGTTSAARCGCGGVYGIVGFKPSLGRVPIYPPISAASPGR